MSESNSDGFDIRAFLLGGASVLIGDEDVIRRPTPIRAGRLLLLRLLLAPGFEIAKTEVIESLWPHLTPAQAANALAKALHALRRMLGGSSRIHVTANRSSIGFARDVRIWTDVDAFWVAAQLSNVDPETGRATLAAALALYRGDLLATEIDTLWAESQRVDLRNQRRSATLEAANLAMATDDARAAIAVLERLLADDPIDEPAHRELIRALLTVGELDRARAQGRRCLEILQRELGVDPTNETITVIESIERRAAETRAAPHWVPDRAHRPPAPPTALVGRQRELELIQGQLAQPQTRLISLIGPGGVGKTRLALEVVNDFADEFAAGSWFIPLAAISQTERWADLVLDELRIERPLGTGDLSAEILKRTIADNELLLVFDNCEHLEGLAIEIGYLLSACPRMRILATSREPLQIRAEHVVELTPLECPAGTKLPSVATLSSLDAVRLFIARAEAASPGFALTDANAEMVVDICRSLDGLPLALELGAARLRQLDLTALHESLGARLDTLSQGFIDADSRHRTMRATVAWSYDNLPADEQRAFRAVCMFAGGFTTDLLDRFDPTVLPLVHALVRRSLVTDGSGTSHARFSILETIRAYGLEQLAMAGEMTRLARAHALACLMTIEQGGEALYGPDQIDWLERLRDERGNIDSALQWTIESSDSEVAARFCAALSRFWQVTSRFDEGLRWIDRLLALRDNQISSDWARALTGAGSLANRAGKLDQSRSNYEQALMIARSCRDRRTESRCLMALGALARRRGELDRAKRLLDESVAVATSVGHDAVIADALNNLGILANLRGDPHLEHDCFAAALERYRALGDDYSVSIVQHNLGDLARRRGDLDTAVAEFEEVLRIARRMESKDGEAATQLALAQVWSARHDLPRARSFAEAAIALLRSLGSVDYLAPALGTLAEIDVQAEDYPAARRHTIDCLRIANDMNDYATLLTALDTIGEIEFRDGNLERAAWLLGVTATARATTGAEPDSVEARVRHEAAVRSALACAEFDRVVSTGEETSLTAAVASILDAG